MRYFFIFAFFISGLSIADEHIVTILKFKFVPDSITIKSGDTVKWVNKEKRQYHSVWFESLEKEDPGYFFPGESYSKTFTDKGEFNYRCGPHPKMKGVVTVK
jgi:plastocyanin